jgi:hypothetical protein
MIDVFLLVVKVHVEDRELPMGASLIREWWWVAGWAEPAPISSTSQTCIDY